jgi:predicted acyltransferase
MNNELSKKRLLSLDVLRGITVAGMILVNNGGGPESYVTLGHSKWNGMTPCDLVFPFFLFIMGISTYLSLRKTNFQISGPVLYKIAKRTVLLFLIGLFINWFDMACHGNASDFAHLRIWAVMQRIAICYCAVSVFAITINHRYTIPTILSLLVIYSIILIIGHGYDYDANTNILARVDLNLFGYDHLYHKSPVDPEGLLSTIPSIAHTMIGFYCCKLMMQAKDEEKKVMQFLLVGGILIFCGYLLSFGLPLNKRIWSPSYVFMTCGLAATLQGLLMYVIDIRGHQKWTHTFLIFGINPLFLYVVSELLAIIFGVTGLKNEIYGCINSVITDMYVASLAYAILFVAIHAALGYPLYKKHIYIKI